MNILSRGGMNHPGTPMAVAEIEKLPGSEAMAQGEADLARLKSDKAQLPERVDVAGLTDYRSFKAIDNEGKNLFDFVTA